MNQLSIKKTNELTKKKKKGFTLVELIIVIAIIAILAAIAIPKFGAVRENSNKSSDVSNAKNIAMAASKAIADNKIDYSAGITNADLSAVNGYDLTTQLDGIKSDTDLKTTGHTSETFKISIDNTGNITVVSSGGAALYPIPNSAIFGAK